MLSQVKDQVQGSSTSLHRARPTAFSAKIQPATRGCSRPRLSSATPRGRFAGRDCRRLTLASRLPNRSASIAGSRRLENGEPHRHECTKPSSAPPDRPAQPEVARATVPLPVRTRPRRERDAAGRGVGRRQQTRVQDRLRVKGATRRYAGNDLPIGGVEFRVRCAGSSVIPRQLPVGETRQQCRRRSEVG